MSQQPRTPDLMPVLSRGRHRTMRKGACFMEMASWLAGQKWSDHPACTHPLLAMLARDVNDHLGDHERQRLAPLIPDVIDTRSTDPRLHAEIARECALAALPVVAERHQRVAAVGLLHSEQILAHHRGEGRLGSSLSRRSYNALADAPHAAEWARRFARQVRPDPKGFLRHGAPQIVHSSVTSLSAAPLARPEDHLVELLTRCIALTRSRCAAEGVARQELAPAPAGPTPASARMRDEARR